MKILQVAPQVPFPLSDGGKVGIFNITKYLALRGHHITFLAADVNRPVDVQPLLEYCELIRVPHSNKNSIAGALRNMVSDIPYNISKYRSRILEERLKEMLRHGNFDVVHVDHLHMAHYGLMCKDIHGIPIVLREHNVESVIMERYLAVTRNPALRRWLQNQLRRIRRYEQEITGKADACCVMTKRDDAALKKLQPDAKTFIIPAGVEKRLFDKTQRTAIPGSLALVGDYSWGPNNDSFTWFLEKIFPKILVKRPEVTVHLIGKNTPSAVLGRERQKNVIVRGLVPDFKEELRKYELLVVPLRVGGGMRLKILESFAMGVPVVSTTVGCEGIEAIHESHLLLGDTEEEFAGQVVRLIGNRRLAANLVSKGYSLVSRRHRWEHIAGAFERVYKGVVRKNRAAKKDRIA